MYGFTGLYGQHYGITITGTSTPTRNSIVSSQPTIYRAPTRQSYRVTETTSAGTFIYGRQADTSWRILSGPQFVGTAITKGSATDSLWQRLEAAYKAGITDISSRRQSAPVEDGTDKELPPEDPGTDWMAYAPLVLLLGVAGAGIYFLRRKK